MTMLRWLRRVVCSLRFHTNPTARFTDPATLVLHCGSCGAELPLRGLLYGESVQIDPPTMEHAERRTDSHGGFLFRVEAGWVLPMTFRGLSYLAVGVLGPRGAPKT